MVERLRITYFAEDTDQSGGVRVQMAHADALIARGHRVRIVTKGRPLQWRSSHAEWVYVRDFSEYDSGHDDFVVATFWTTVAGAFAAASRHAVHFCQGYEGSFTAYRTLRPQIDAAYRIPIPKITVSPHLVEICRRFHPDATCIGQIVDSEFYQPHPRRRSRPPRVLLVGPMQSDFKGIDVGYAAVRHARRRGARFDLIRVSQWAPAESEETDLASEFHIALDTPAIARLIASCDLFIGPSREQEGFGLPAAEALASGLPAVLSAISSFTSWDTARDYALFAPEGDAVAMGEGLERLLGDQSLSDRLARRGREVVEQFRAERTAVRLERYFLDRLTR